MMQEGLAMEQPTLDDVVIKVSIGIGHNLAEAEQSLARAKSKKHQQRYYNVETYRSDPLPSPDTEPNPVVDSFIRLEKRLLSQGMEEDVVDLHNLKYDSKTGLLNRMGYAVEVKKLMERYAYNNRIIILIDGDDMKKANSTLGYEQTDRYIEAIGRALKSSLRQTPFTKTGMRETDVLLNRKNDSGGDEFIVDLECPYHQAETVAMRYVDAMYAAQREVGK
jgi:GGDEF domain-containing protein